MQPEAFWKKLSGANQCWNWTGRVNNSGYGWVRVNGKTIGAHRAALEFMGINTAGRYVLHHCDNARCCNPTHLYLGSQRENMTDAELRGRSNRAAKAHHGSAHGRAKLTEADVLSIRQRAAEWVPVKDPATGRWQKSVIMDAAREYGLTYQSIYDIVRRNSWTHI